LHPSRGDRHRHLHSARRRSVVLRCVPRNRSDAPLLAIACNPPGQPWRTAATHALQRLREYGRLIGWIEGLVAVTRRGVLGAAARSAILTLGRTARRRARLERPIGTPCCPPVYSPLFCEAHTNAFVREKHKGQRDSGLDLSQRMELRAAHPCQRHYCRC
jgi:hypothetical protein